MNINDWNYDFESLPYWDLRNKKLYTSDDKIYENSQLDTAFLIYSISEYRMGWYAGFLAILKNKMKPELILRCESCFFSNSEIIFSKDGNLAFVKGGFWADGWPIFIFDLKIQKFAYYTAITEICGFTVTEDEFANFVIVADKWAMEQETSGLLKKLNGTIIKIKSLKWKPFKNIDSFCTQLWKAHHRVSLFKKICRFLSV